MRISPSLDSQIPGQIAFFLACAKGNRDEAASLAYSRGASQRVVQMIKSPVLPGVSTDAAFGSGLLDRPAAVAYFDLLRHRSAFFYALANGMRRVPFRQRCVVSSFAATGFVKGVAPAPTPLTSLNLVGADIIEPGLAVAIVVVSDEVKDDQSGASEALVNAELRGAVSDAIDVEFFDVLDSSSPPIIASTGNDPDDALLDVRGLFETVQTHANWKPLIACAADVAKRATFLRDGGGYLFPDMTALGGQISGVEVIVCSALMEGDMWLMDLNSIAGGAGDMGIDNSRIASLEMKDASLTQDPATSTGASLVSLWQNHLVAIRAQVEFGVKVVRAGAIGRLVGVEWGGEVPAS